MRFGRLMLVGLIAAAVVPLPGAAPATVRKAAAEKVEGRYLVGFEAGVTPAHRAALHARLGARHVRSIDVIDVDVVDLPRGVDGVSRYARVAGVRFAEPDYVGHLALMPNDPCVSSPCVPGAFGSQWQLGFTNGMYAWDVYPGNVLTSAQRQALPAGSLVRVAVVDTKIDTAHPDWVNLGGTSPDVTKGGQLDIANAKDYIPANQQTGGAQYHSTFVAGILGAAAGNGYGLAGLAYHSQILPITAVDGGGRAVADHVASSVIYAWQKGARVINLSLGLTEYSQAVHDAIKVVTAGNAQFKPSLVVAAAGNCGGNPDLCDDPFYPGSHPEVISVSGTDATDRRAHCSNYNANVSVSAPADGVISLKIGGGVMRGLCGTSAATPQVSALAALLFGQNPNRTPAEVRDIIRGTADDRGTPGRDVYFGFGRINAERALRSGQTIAVSTAAAATIPPATGGTSTVTALSASTRGITKAEVYLDDPGCDGAPGTPMQIADAGAGYKRLTATLQIPASTIAGPHPIFVRAFDGVAWGPFTVGVLYVDRGKPLLSDPQLTPLVVRSVSSTNAAFVGYTIADDYSTTFIARLQVFPKVSTLAKPPPVYTQILYGVRAGGNVFEWRPDSSIPAGTYRVAVDASDEAYNWSALPYEDTITVV